MFFYPELVGRLNFQIRRYDGLNGSVVAFKEQAAVIVHVDDAACFFDGSSTVAIAVLIGAVVVHDDGAAGADKLVHAFPSIDPGANAEGFELPDGAFEVADEHLQQLFAVDGMSENCLERGDFTIQVGVIGGVAIDVDADSHRKDGARRIFACHSACINDFR